MNDTHTFDNNSDSPDKDATETHPVAALADLDPADAPAAAERYAAALAADLEDAGAPAPDPVQLRADLDDGKEIDRT